MSESTGPAVGPHLPALPARRDGRRRERHGRGPRGPLLPWQLPGWRTRADRFDDLLLDAVERLEKGWAAELSGVEIAVEDVPPSDPAPWEHRAIALGRYYAGDRAAGLPRRIVVYRRPVESRAVDAHDLGELVTAALVEQVAAMLGRTPGEIDPDHPGA
ncbi:metallopeptidase family protein [Georgenia sp. Z1344]|uniref:metallopeptidase family protein n=1 Tax=Georgenia sp. Z1344 TaxID=3416706 RepID=UPI003CF711FD